MGEEVKKNWFARHKVLTGIVGVILLLGIGSAMSSTGSVSTDTADQNQGATQEAPVKKESKKLSSQEIYEKVQPGMTKEEVIKIAGHDPDNCINSDSGTFGSSETCSYGTLSLIFMNGELESKTKL
ncbi:MAG TPA: hypothetical protein VIF43_02085 [Patescibacteria group bacterium]|jgi:hypothetical protein